jgi:hypothetical protein
MWTSRPLRSVISFGVGEPRHGNVDAFDAPQLAAYNQYRARHG